MDTCIKPYFIQKGEEKMTKFEFLGDLSRLIADLPQEEVDQAMEYYEDYFADAGPEKEQEIIRDFISPAYTPVSLPPRHRRMRLWQLQVDL